MKCVILLCFIGVALAVAPHQNYDSEEYGGHYPPKGGYGGAYKPPGGYRPGGGYKPPGGAYKPPNGGYNKPPVAEIYPIDEEECPTCVTWG